MKKVFAVLLCVICSLSLLSCSNEGKVYPTPPPVPEAKAEPTATPEPVETEAPADLPGSAQSVLDMDGLQTQQVLVEGMALEIPADAAENSDADYTQYVSYGADGLVSWISTITISSYAYVSSFDDLLFVSDIYWDSVTNTVSNTQSYEEETVQLAGDVPGLVIRAEGDMSGERFYVRLLLFYFDGRVYEILTAQQYGPEYAPYFEKMLSTMELSAKEPDFLTDRDRRWEVSTLNNKLDYEPLIALCDSYIAENAPAESDPVYAIRDAAAAALEGLAACHVVVDEFSGNTMVYGSVDAISPDVNFVPYISAPDSEFDFLPSYCTLKVGFRNPDWLFFDEVQIKTGDGQFITERFDYDDVAREVLSGSAVQEDASMALSTERVEQIINAESPSMRFTGENDKTLDHTLTESERASLAAVYAVAGNRILIRTTISDWADKYD